MEITLIRHTSVNVEAGICYGISDVDVAESFETEAKLIRNKLLDEKFDAVFSSPLLRCIKLATYCQFDNIQFDDRLVELNFGDWEMKAWDSISDPQLEKWYSDWINEKATNGESFTEQLERVKTFVKDIKALKLDKMAIFTHAGVIRCFGIIFEQFPINKAFEMKVEYGQINKFQLQGI